MPKPSANTPGGRAPSARLSITIPADDYRGLKAAAARQRVSLAWIGREAIRRYLAANRTSPKKR